MKNFIESEEHRMTVIGHTVVDVMVEARVTLQERVTQAEKKIKKQ